MWCRLKKIAIISFLSLVYFFGVSFIFPNHANAWLDGYAYRKSITVQADNIDASLTNFPLYVFIDNDAEIGAGIQDTTNYYDLRFTDTSDTILSFEQENMAISGGVATGHFWVKTDLDSTSGSTIYLYYGKENDTNGSNASGVWDDNYAGVWHMSQGASTAINYFTDSTSNNNHGTLVDSNSSTTQVNGKFGKALDFDGAADYIRVNDHNSLDLNTHFIEAWTYPHTIVDNASYGVIGKGTDTFENYGMIVVGWGGQKFTLYGIRFLDGTNPRPQSNNGLLTNNWYHIVHQFTGSAMSMYVNGTAQSSITNKTSTPVTNARPLLIGAEEQGVDNLYRFFDGVIDEVRISNSTTARPASWVKFQYANMGGQVDNELSWNAQENNPVPSPTPTPTPTPTPKTSSSDSNSSASTPSCSDTVPSGIPDLFQIDTTTSQATLYFTPITNISTYYISYSKNSLAEEHGAKVVIGSEGVQNYTISLLSPSTTYYFKVRGQNGCMPGSWSNILSATTNSPSASSNSVSTIIKTVKKSLAPKKELDIVSSEEISKPSSVCSYTVKHGESLWVIAQEKLGDGFRFDDIQELNQLSSKSLEIGQELKLPCNKEEETITEAKEEIIQEGIKLDVLVKDSSNNPIEGVEVTLHSKVQVSTTDQNGIAKFENVESGEHRVILAYNDYEGEQKLTVDGSQKEQVLTLQIEMKQGVGWSTFLLSIAALGIVIIVLSIHIYMKKRSDKRN